jgi:hypothetical protein
MRVDRVSLSPPPPAALATTRAQRRQLGQTQTSLDPNVRTVTPAPHHSSNPDPDRSLPNPCKRVSFGPLPHSAAHPSLAPSPHRDTTNPSLYLYSPCPPCPLIPQVPMASIGSYR